MKENDIIEAAYKQGFKDGITAYAWWKDGRQEVGTTGTLLKDAITDKEIENSWNYNPAIF